MQATQSRTASAIAESKDISGQFATLQHMSLVMELRCDEGAPESPTARLAESVGLAHDAGNLLGALSLYSDLLAMPGVLRDEHKKYAAELRLLSERSWALIDRLVNHAQSESKPYGGPTVLLEVVERFRGLLGKIAGREMEIVWNAGGFQAVDVPAETVERIVTNLVKNAAEATPWVGAISIHVEGLVESANDEVRRRVAMTVRDRGCGMDQAAVKRLMQAGGISSGNGRGLGFRVVRELVAISGGCLSVESQPDVGTSISAEWHAVKRSEAELRRDEMRVMELEVKKVLKGEAGWIAC
jgi:signal transduction histidine kinase